MILHCLHSAPNFGKTAGFLKSPVLTEGYGPTKSFSEIGALVMGLVVNSINQGFLILLATCKLQRAVQSTGHFVGNQ